MNESANDPRDAWLRACDRYERVAQLNAYFTPMAGVVRALAIGPCAQVAGPRVDGFDLHLVRSAAPDPAAEARPDVGDADSDALDVRVRALTDGAIEIRCDERAPRGRTRVRVVSAIKAPAAVEECLREIGWLTEAVWSEWR